MEAVPPLPWAADVQGGTLRLNRAVSIQDLLDGMLNIRVADDHEERDGEIVEYPSDNKIYIEDGNGNFMYEIQRFEGSSKTIHLTKTESTPSDAALISVQFAPPVEYSPELPWDNETEGATIKIYPALTQEQIENGLLLIKGKDENTGTFFSLINFTAGKLVASYSGRTQFAQVIVHEDNDKINQIDISNILQGYEILSIEKNAGEILLLPEADLPLTGDQVVSCSKGLTFDEVLAHVKLKFIGDSDFVAAQQRDQYGCEWVSSSNNAIRFGFTRANNNAVPYIELNTSTSATLAAIKYGS